MSSVPKVSKSNLFIKSNKVSLGTQLNSDKVALVVKNPSASAADSGSVPGWRMSPVGGKGNPLQYSCLGNLVDRGAWWATVHGVAKESDMT